MASPAVQALAQVVTLRHAPQRNCAKPVEKAHSMRFRTGFAKSLLRLHAGALQLATTLRLHSFFLTMKQAV